MNIAEGRQSFIEHWGKMGPKWGINRCMAQIHALLLISPRPLCAETIMDELCISRGSVNTNLRALIEWGLVKKKLKPGERKEFFVGEKDMWTIFKCIVQQRRKKELEPMLTELQRMKDVHGDTKETEEYLTMIDSIYQICHKADTMLDTVVELEESMLNMREFSAYG